MMKGLSHDYLSAVSDKRKALSKDNPLTALRLPLNAENEVVE